MRIYPTQFTSIDRTPFTYYLRHKITKMRYYGSKTSKGCDPKDLWSTYFSSSKIIEQIIKDEGKDIFEYRIARIFNDIKHCRNHESKFLTRQDAAHNPLWYNQTNSDGKFSRAGKTDSIETRSRKSKALFGLEKSNTHKQHISESNKGKHYIKKSEESKKKLSTKMMGENNPFYGRNHSIKTKQIIGSKSKGRNVGKVVSEETRQKMSKSNKGKAKSPMSQDVKENWITMMANRVWVRKENTSKRIKETELESYLSRGFTLGRYYSKK